MADIELGRAFGRYICRYRGEDLPVTHLVRGAQEVADLDDAISFVAGPMRSGKWMGDFVGEHDIVRVS